MKKIIIYDFDGTLTPFPLPKLEILEKCALEDGASNPDFMKRTIERAETKGIDIYLAMYEVYLEIIKNAGFKAIDDNMALGADKVVYNQGVPEFLKMLTENDVDNYLLSSGLKIFLERTSVAEYFKDIYATTFVYDANNEAEKADFVMSDKNKVVAIKEILARNNLTDCSDVIYIGDGLTDSYAMRYVKENGGITIFVYTDPNNKDLATMQEENIVSAFIMADFSTGSELNFYIKKECRIPIRN